MSSRVRSPSASSRDGPPPGVPLASVSGSSISSADATKGPTVASSSAPYELAKQLTKEKHKHLLYVAGYLKKRAQVEFAYAKMVQKLVQQSLEDMVDWTEDDAFYEIWTAFLDVENEYAEGHAAYGKNVDTLPDKLSTHCAASKKNYLKIKNDTNVTSRQNLSPLLYKLWQASDTKLNETLDQHFQWRTELLQTQVETSKTMSESLKEEANEAQNSASQDNEAGVDELLDSLPGSEVTDNRAKFRKVQYIPSGQSGGGVSRTKTSLEINMDDRTFQIGHQKWKLDNLIKFEKLPRFHSARAKESTRERKKSSQVQLYWPGQVCDTVVFKTFIDEEVFCSVLKILLQQRFADVPLQPLIGETNAPPIVISDTVGRRSAPIMTQTCGVVSLFVGTFNMGGTQLPKNGIAEWISPGHDLYCIGVQEIGLSAIKGDNPEDDEEDITALVWEQIKNSIEEIVFTASTIQEPGEWTTVYHHAIKRFMDECEDMVVHTSAELVDIFQSLLETNHLPEVLVTQENVQKSLIEFSRVIQDVLQTDATKARQREAAIHRTLAQKKKLTKEATHDSWFEAIAEHLGDSFEVLATNNLWAIRMVVFVRKVYVPHITQVEQAKVATGIGGVAGNKGGVGVSFRLLDSSICLVNSHLAAHQDKIKERNHDYYRISKHLDLGSVHLDVLNQFDHVFWLGDLNYRIDLPREETLQFIQKEDYASLRKGDQLVREMDNGRAFVGFSEAHAPTFPPTYKYEKGADGKRAYTDKKNRTPSYCDRILVRSAHARTTFQPECISYNDTPSFVLSDHSPVAATFFLPIRRPYIPKSIGEVNLEVSRCNIRLTDVVLSPMVTTSAPSSSGVFIRFHGDFVPVVYTSAITMAKKEGSWRWENDDLPVLRPHVPDVEYIQAQVLVLSFHMRLGKDSAADKIGQCMLPLSLSDGSSAPAAFAVEVTYAGRIVGMVRGQIALQEIMSSSSPPPQRKSISADSVSSDGEDETPVYLQTTLSRRKKLTPPQPLLLQLNKNAFFTSPSSPGSPSPPSPRSPPTTGAPVQPASPSASSSDQGKDAPQIKEKKGRFRFFFGKKRKQTSN